MKKETEISYRDDQNPFDLELEQKLKGSVFENLANRLDEASPRCKAILEDVVDLMNAEIPSLEKIKLLNGDKNTILFELIYSENFETYKAITGKPKSIQKKPLENNSANLAFSDSMKEALECMAKPVFNSEFTTERLFYLQMTEEIENKIAEILLGQRNNSQTNVSEVTEVASRNKTTKYTRQQFGIFIKLMQEQNIITHVKDTASFLLEKATGISHKKQARDIPSKVEYLDHVDEDLLEQIKQDLQKMIENIEIFNGENKRK